MFEEFIILATEMVWDDWTRMGIAPQSSQMKDEPSARYETVQDMVVSKACSDNSDAIL